MSASLLREAAALMRERAMHACPDGAWYDRHDLCDALTPVADTVDDPAADADHIASWHPAVALAVADWLKSVAADVDKRDNPLRVGGRFEVLRIPDEHAALAVARAYLGRDS